jgi:hypothetical protein
LENKIAVRSSDMFWKRSNKDEKKNEKLPTLSGPRDIPEHVKKYLASDRIIDANLVPFLKAVIKSSEKGGRIFDIRLFDPADARAKEIEVKDYDSLTGNPDLIVSEGSFDEASKKIELTMKNASIKVKLYSFQEILKQIEGLKEPGSSIMFYTSTG